VLLGVDTRSGSGKAACCLLLLHLTSGGAQARDARADVVLLKREALDAAAAAPGGAEAMLEQLRYVLSGDD
jgi:hypothetical protein